jgi:hypothetical protein
MNHARLVKRKDLLEREQVKETQTPPTSSNPGAVQSVIDWIEGRQPKRGLNPRQAFAALFSQPQTS